MAKTLTCPKCQAEMEKLIYEGIEVDRCTNCKGLWFDALEKEKLREFKGAEQLDSGSPEIGRAYNDVDRINCPVCSAPMIRMVIPQQHHIWFESCAVCHGVFFDAGEFRDYIEDSAADFLKDLLTKERE